MPLHQQPRVTRMEAAPYRSGSCRIGTHHACTESSPAAASVDVPVIYEACDCACHTALNRDPSAEVAR